ncbi:DUF6069 family protein [Streptomyces sp. VRA16 Mangrove soil]|uniref:DUF6069 family protein n=1 Tax=Streptomyces sp. VRA16 Mangrove soil TaxID=2817434 RepID=UPI001A9F022D|nr:DUF6069 family protein [Streptomyces sp. VRA16 Mangrove soil]MBO1329951.1 hypothetical protein [Streptomyces sp. VRA16 Mangrove soil]
MSTPPAPDPYGNEPGYRNPYGTPAYATYEEPADHRQDNGPGRPGPRVDAGRLWAGGAVTAVVAALAAVVCVLLVRGVLGVPVFAPEGNGAFGDASTGLLAGAAFVATLVATLLLHLLILAVPQPGRFFQWIIGLATAAMTLMPFTTDLPWTAKFGTAAVYLVIGVAVGSLLSAVGRSAMRGAGQTAR